MKRAVSKRFLMMALIISASAPLHVDASSLDRPIIYVRYPRVGPNVDAAGNGLYGNRYDYFFDADGDGNADVDFSYDNRCYGDPGDSGEPACPSSYAITQAPPLPDVEFLYRVGEGGDLAYLPPHAEAPLILVNHDESKPAGQPVGSVLDTTISPDGKWVAYAQIENVRLDDPYDLEGGVSRINIYKLYIGDLLGLSADALKQYVPRTPTCLSCKWDYQLNRFAGYDPALDDEIDVNNAYRLRLREVAFVSPLWLPDGRIVFGSTMAAEAMSGMPNLQEERTDFVALQEMEPALQLWIMDANPDKPNLHRISPSALGRLQHPTFTEDGRIVATSWEMAFRRRIHNGFSLVQLYPDGSNFGQFAGRHQTMSNSLHFATALPGNKFCSPQYYNDQSAGFGSFLCFPVDPAGPDFTDDGWWAYSGFAGNAGITISTDGVLLNEWENDDGKFSFYLDTLNRQERVSSWFMTPRMSNFDENTPDWRGRVTQLSPALGGEGLVSWTPGGVNKTQNGALPANPMPQIDAGIYLVNNTDDIIDDPWTDLTPVINDVDYNEMWPRVVAPLTDIFTDGFAVSQALPTEAGEPLGYLQSASIRTRLTDSDCIDTAKGSDALSDAKTRCYWHTQGTTAGVVGDDDLAGIRVLAVIPEGLSKGWEPDFPSYSPYQYYNKAWYSPGLDRVYILGEFSTLKRDAEGNLIMNAQDSGASGTIQPDTSYVVKVPAWVPIFQQGLDRKGFATSTETTWHHVAPRERKTCVGCHMKTQETPTFAQSAAGQNPDLYEVDVALQTPFFTGKTDANGDPVVATAPDRMLGVEWTRDIGPMLKTHCAACHSASAPAAGLRLDDSIESYQQLAVPVSSDEYKLPQITKWVRLMQARQSILAWYAYGERLDGRPAGGDAESRGGFDWTFDPAAVAVNHNDSVIAGKSADGTALSAAERLTLARWIDIGVPIDLKQYYDTSGASADTVAWKTRRSYLNDDYPPTITMAGIPQPNPVGKIGTIIVGFWDNEAIDPASFKVTLNGGANLARPPADGDITQSIAVNLNAGSHAIRVEVADTSGNKSSETWDVTVDPSLKTVDNGGSGSDTSGSGTGDTGATPSDGSDAAPGSDGHDNSDDTVEINGDASAPFGGDAGQEADQASLDDDLAGVDAAHMELVSSGCGLDIWTIF